jgi:hypothetical protein
MEALDERMLLRVCRISCGSGGGKSCLRPCLYSGAHSIGTGVIDANPAGGGCGQLLKKRTVGREQRKDALRPKKNRAVLCSLDVGSWVCWLGHVRIPLHNGVMTVAKLEMPSQDKGPLLCFMFRKVRCETECRSSE